MSSATAATIVACNIYITASSSHKSTLLRILRNAQEQCERLRRVVCAGTTATTMRQQRGDGGSSIGSNGITSSSSSSLAGVGVIHAHADIPYDRSSFHLAGRSDCVALVANELIRTALNDIDIDILPKTTTTTTTKSTTIGGNNTRHPYVGLVDHVSIMPLNYYCPSSSNESESEKSQSLLLPTKDEVYSNRETTTNNNDRYKVASNVAYEIGKQMMGTKLVNVHYYGHACPRATPLAEVRRERTTFFNSGGATDSTTTASRRGTKQNSQHIPATTTVAHKGDSIVGVPNNFVENFNIRLTSNVTFHQAKSLTQLLRGRNIINHDNNNGYGIDGVEALTLKYARDDISSRGIDGDGGGTVYEVACNITKPKVGGVTEILAQLEKWIILQLLQQCHQSSSTIEITDMDYKYYVEDAYRVGTTQEQCLRVLFDGRDSVQHCDNNTSMTNNDVIYWKEYDKQVFNTFDKLLSR